MQRVSIPQRLLILRDEVTLAIRSNLIENECLGSSIISKIIRLVAVLKNVDPLRLITPELANNSSSLSKFTNENIDNFLSHISTLHCSSLFSCVSAFVLFTSRFEWESDNRKKENCNNRVA